MPLVLAWRQARLRNPSPVRHPDGHPASTFLLFCTKPEAVQPSYRRFLENRLREQFDLEGAPIRIRLRARHDNSER